MMNMKSSIEKRRARPSPFNLRHATVTSVTDSIDLTGTLPAAGTSRNHETNRNTDASTVHAAISVETARSAAAHAAAIAIAVVGGDGSIELPNLRDEPKRASAASSRREVQSRSRRQKRNVHITLAYAAKSALETPVPVGADLAQLATPSDGSTVSSSLVMRCNVDAEWWNVPGPPLKAKHAARMTTGHPNANRSRVPQECSYLIRRDRTDIDPLRRRSLRFRHTRPTPDPNYVSGPRDRRFKLLRTIDSSVAGASVVAEYDRIFGKCPKTSVGVGLVERGLFLDEEVAEGTVIMEYTGIRIHRRDSQVFNDALDYFGLSPEMHASVPSENAIVDARWCGNYARYANHSCSPNCILQEIDVKGRTVVALVSLMGIREGSEVVFDYKYFTGGTANPMRCLNRSPICRNYI